MNIKDKKKQIALSVFGILLLVLITVGVTYAVFTYTKQGSTENTVTAGTLKFLYIENESVGNGISISEAVPVSDTIGKSYSTEGQVFDFTIEATNTSNDIIPYEITLRKKNISTLKEDAVKVYLTDMTEGTDTEILTPTLYSKLVQTDIDVGEEIEKTIYDGVVNGNTSNYLKKFRLRMWIDENVDLSNEEYSGKTFTATVNVYSNAKVISEEEVSLRNNTEINSFTVGKTTLSKEEDYDYDYETILDEGTTSTAIDIETTNPNATVEIEKLNNLAYETTNIRNISTNKNLNLAPGNNYFNIKVTSENKKQTTEYKVNIIVGYSTLHQNIDSVVSSFDDSELKNAIACNIQKDKENNNYYHRCKTYDTLTDSIKSRNLGITILTNDISESLWLNNKSQDMIIELNGYDIIEKGDTALKFDGGKFKIQDRTKKSYIYHSLSQAINIGANSNVEIDYVNIKRLDTTETTSNPNTIWIASGCDGCKLTINDAKINTSIGSIVAQNGNSKNSIVDINNGEFYTTGYQVIYADGKNNIININNGKMSISGMVIKNVSTNSIININGGEITGIVDGNNQMDWNCTIVNQSSGTINITGNTVIKNNGQKNYSNCGIINDGNGVINISGSNATFDSSGNYLSGIYLKTVTGQGIRNEGILKVNGITVESRDNSVTVVSDDAKTYISKGVFNNSIRNEKTGTIQICGGEITNINSQDLKNHSTGYIYYKSNVILKNNTFYDANDPTHIILDDTLTCSE